MTVVNLHVVVVDASLDPGAPMWGDAAGEGFAPALEWVGTLTRAGVPVRCLASDIGDPGDGLLVVPAPDAWPGLVDRAVAARRPLLTGPPPASGRDRLALVTEALGALVRPDLRGVLVLRVDDAGAAQRQHSAAWRYDAPLAAWDQLWETLAAGGRMSVFCCPGWVEDDGSIVDARARQPEEWATLDRGVHRGVADLECHGYTHQHPDTAAWAASPDRHENLAWYRELAPPFASEEPSVAQQEAIIAAWQAACGMGTTLVAPGEAWGLNTLAAARARGLRLFNSWSVCRLDLPVPTWAAGAGSPYLDEAAESWFDDGLPVVGYWHDRDMAIHGPGWAPDRLDEWRAAGATRLWAFADLARVYATPVVAALVDGDPVIRQAPPGPLLVDRAG